MLPEALVHSLMNIPGFDESGFREAHNMGSFPVSIRINPAKIESAETIAFGLEEVPWSNTGYYLPQRPVFTLDPLLHAGAYYVQEASSMFLEQAFMSIPGHREPLQILDLCAAPGGKSTHLLSLMSPLSLLVCNEVIQTRTSILLENITKWGNSHVIVTQNDPAEFGKSGAQFDVILADAPCSGSGLFRRDPKAINEWSEQAVALCGSRQQRILADVWPSLKPGGYLIYATCSYSVTEDEDIADWLAEEFGAKGLPIPCDSNAGVLALESRKHQMPCYRFFPGQVKGEGLFMALLQKPGVLQLQQGKQVAEVMKKKMAVPALLQAWLKPQMHMLSYRHKELIFLMSPQVWQFFNEHQSDLRIRQAGIRAAEMIRENFNPLHGLALSTVLDQGKVNVADLNREEALQYLRKQDISLPDLPNGWVLIRNNNLTLGWVKNLGSRVNNYYPKDYRIRMG